MSDALSIGTRHTSVLYSEASAASSKEAHFVRQDSMESLDQDWAFVSASNSPNSIVRSVTPEPFDTDSIDFSDHGKKPKKDKKKFGSMFRRHKKHKDKQLDSPSHNLGVSIGTAETQQSFSSSKLKRSTTGPSHQYLTPPIYHRRKSSPSSSLPASDREDGDFSDASYDDEFIATLLNPSLAVANRQKMSTKSLSTPEIRPDSRLSTGSGVESEPAETESKTYNVTVTLHSGNNLAIRDRTGSSDPYVKLKCGHFKYRSAVVHRSLNPEWNETFSFRTSDLSTPLVARVFDHDFGSLDDYMGGQSLNLQAYTTSEVQIVDLGLEDPTAAAKGENLGFIRLFVQVTMVTEGDSHDDKRTAGTKPSKSIQVWNGLVTVLLVEGTNLPSMDSNGFSDPYCKLKLGKQSCRSKTIPKSLDPKWMERFGLRLFDGSTTMHIEVWDKDFPRSDDFIGSCTVELSSLKQEVTHRLTLDLSGGKDQGSITLLVTITGTKITESLSVDMGNMAKKYNLLKSFKLRRRERKDVGYLRVRVDRAENLPVVDTCAAVELGNSMRITQTVYKTTNPSWDKTFEFKVEDIHDELEVTLYKESKKIGKVKIPLHSVQSGVCLAYPLKTKNCLERAKGVVFVECELVYNPLRAAIRTINPREHKYLEAEEKFSRKVLMNNISRVTQLIRTIVATVELVKSFFSWEDKMKSSCAFIIFVIATIFGDLWMVLVAGSIVFGYCYMVVYIRGKHVWQHMSSQNSSKSLSVASDDLDGFSDFSDIEEDLNSNKGRTNLREKFKQLQEILLIVQTVLGTAADMEERVKNLFLWSVPFLCWMAIVILMVAAVVVYFVPLRLIILVWGVNKFSKRLRNPNFVDNNEILDFLSRSPTNKQLDQYRRLTTHLSTVNKNKAQSKKQKSTDKDKKKR
ncbi:multiple C2 and transmembrane domain-containing protein 1-like [Halichondria panicea]|uniref:multiple C2 and transmembrane domain-containing protein 1-like n=1 Tax=Halichondria panicea TaxID=6063 RepID=UPI00312BA306